MIDPNDIQAGDRVAIQDVHRNIISGPAHLTGTKTGPTGIAVMAFGLEIPFAKRDPILRTFTMMLGVTLIDHQGQLRSNPT